MVRKSKTDRREIVLAAAYERVRNRALEWTSSITFLELSIATGIDQSQIARDFGSKDDLANDLIVYMLDGDRYGHYEEEVASLAEDVDMRTLHDLLSQWATDSDRRNRQGQDLTSEMLLWSAAGPKSTEWDSLAKLYRRMLDHFEGIAQGVLEAAEASGAVVRNELTTREFAMVLTAVVEGLAIRASVEPSLVAPDLTERVAMALAAAVVGPTAETPSDQMRSIVIQASESE